MPRAFLSLILMIISVSSALAQGPGPHQGDHPGPGDNLGGSAGGNGQGSANGPGNGNATAGQGKADPSEVAPGPDVVPDSALRYTPDHARDAVNAGKAVTLGSLLPDLNARGSGEVIDAEMLNVNGFLVYAIKVLRPNGLVTTEYYYAQSGRFIGSE